MNDGASTWAAAVAAGLIAGLSKTGLPGCGILAVPLMIMVFPAKQAMGALLPLLITADICAVTFYHRHAQWKKLFELFPCVLGGIAAASLVLWKIKSEMLKPMLGILIMGLVILEAARRYYGWTAFPRRKWFVVLMGSLAGFATTVGNVAGPIMNIYFMSRELKVAEFMGTLSWFFFAFNCVKIPIYISLGMINAATLKFDLMMAPVAVAGACAGFFLLRTIPPRAFNYIVLSLAALAAMRLLI